MSKVKRIKAAVVVTTFTDVKHFHGSRELRDVVLASDYDALLAKLEALVKEWNRPGMVVFTELRRIIDEERKEA